MASPITKDATGSNLHITTPAIDRSLYSLSRFLDVLFALAFFACVEFLPSYADGHWVRLPYGLLSLLASSPANIARVVFGLIMIAYFWLRKITLLSLVERSNCLFATLVITSMAFLLLFLYALAADPTYIGGPPTLLLQSVSFLGASLLGYIALRYAVHEGFVPSPSHPTAERMARIDLANPITAVIATGLSRSGLTIWTLSWFVLWPLFSWLLARRKPA